jgi:hypothetical protein
MVYYQPKAIPDLSWRYWLQVGAGISSTSLRLLLRASPNLLEISIGLGAEISDEDIAFMAAACPLLQRAHFAFLTISDAGDSRFWD